LKQAIETAEERKPLSMLSLNEKAYKDYEDE
jgi:hypothetical protein